MSNKCTDYRQNGKINLNESVGPVIASKLDGMEEYYPRTTSCVIRSVGYSRDYNECPRHYDRLRWC